MSDAMCVMRDGKILEAGFEEIYANPKDDVTRRLIEAIPRDDVDLIRARQAARQAVV